jgi:Kef-type K+ transport system membrane component KefB
MMTSELLAGIADTLQIVPWPPQPDALLASAAVLVVGALLGQFAERVLRLPSIVGYAAIGMVVAWAGFGLPEGRLPVGWRLVVDLALAVMLFELGSRVHLRWLRRNPALGLTSAAESILGFIAIYVVLRLAELAPADAAAAAVVLSIVAASVVGRVAAESKSAGQVTDRLMLLTALNTLYGVLALKIVGGWVRLGHPQFGIEAIAQPLYTFAGSLLLAALLARIVLALAPRLDLRDENGALLLLGLVLLALAAARALGVSTLLVPLAAGVMLRNATARPWVWPRHFGTAGGVLVLMMFVVVGTAWSVQTLEAGAALALAVLLARGAARAIVVVGLARWSGLQLRQGAAIALGMLPLSASALVLLADWYVLHPESALRIAPIVLSAIVLVELLGPVAVQAALRIAGETPSGSATPPGSSS